MFINIAFGKIRSYDHMIIIDLRLPVAPPTNSIRCGRSQPLINLGTPLRSGCQAWWAGGCAGRIEGVVGSGCAQHESNTTPLDRPVGRLGGLCAWLGQATTVWLRPALGTTCAAAVVKITYILYGVPDPCPDEARVGFVLISFRALACTPPCRRTNREV